MDKLNLAIIGAHISPVFERHGTFYVPNICIINTADSSTLIKITMEMEEGERNYMDGFAQLFGMLSFGALNIDTVELNLLGLAMKKIPKIVTLDELHDIEGESLSFVFNGLCAPLRPKRESCKSLARHYKVITPEDTKLLDKHVRLVNVGEEMDLIGYFIQHSSEELVGISLESLEAWLGKAIDVDMFFSLEMPLYRLSNDLTNLITALCGKYNFTQEVGENTVILSLLDIRDKYAEIIERINSGPARAA